ncbi:ABC transporter substrate-binding protein [Mycetocola tolaasinivorans]|uniref:ABC transporter substrate-binding protein n=1 Tax=Mycetocola tolaasinivorans TaxID=76635 RepID=A0A3L7A3H0_9MICO|nr:ABC transporter substrate-binding protein [Mycetocola tolaasinivorans]RLP74081.1 ABC transporter substrate-binding protein [Mycetocola tolaasinivorans]
MRLGPKKLLPLLGTLTLAALLAGCAAPGAATPGGGTKDVGAPVDGGTLTFATDREPRSLDSAAGQDQPQALIARAYLDSLVRQESDGSFTPWLAKSWEISPDDLTYTLHLRTDVHFTDGTPFNAAAVKANVDYWLDPATAASETSSAFENFKSLETPDDSTVVITLSAPYADFLSVLASSFAGIQSPAGIARGIEGNAAAPIGSGPFKIESWDKQSQVVLVRNKDYNWAPATAAHQGPAHLDKIIWRFISEPTTRFAALQSGEVDAIETIPPESFQTATSSDNLTLIDGKRAGVPVQLDFNTKRAPFNDVSVRQAFRYATDVEAGLKSVFFGAYQGFGGALSPSTIFFDPAFEKTYTRNLDKANKLLDEAGWTTRDSAGYRTKDGKRLTANVSMGFGTLPQEYFLLDQIQGSVKEVGIDLQYEKLDDGQAAQRRADWDYDLTKDYWGGPNTAAALFFLYESTQNIPTAAGYHNNGTGYENPELDAAINQANLITDPAKRQALYSTAQKIISEQALAVPLYIQPLQYLYRNDRVAGVNTDPRSNQASFYDSWVLAR